MLLNVNDYRRAARNRLPRFIADYVDGTADDGRCFARNLSDLAQVELTPRILQNTTTIDTSIEVFGCNWKVPFGIAPMGLNGLIRPRGDALLASAAQEAGAPFALSTASNIRLEDIADPAAEAGQWMQLYVMHRKLAESIVKRAEAAGFSALILTVDVPVSGNRELDTRNGFRLPFKVNSRVLWDLATHPRWSIPAALSGVPEFVNAVPEEEANSPEVQAQLLARAMDRSVVWESLHWLRRLWKGPLLLKGVLHPDDASMAVNYGVDGLIVSNHGGRQLDSSPSSISSLSRVAHAVNGRIPVFMDGGIRRGHDIAAALALGATGVFVGRPMLYGLAVNGETGAKDIFRILKEELIRSMTLAGTSTIAELRSQTLASAPWLKSIKPD